MILLDTHVLVWLDQGNKRLGTRARQELDLALKNDALIVSAISFWELAMLQIKGRIQLPPLRRWRNELMDMGLQEITINGECAISANQLTDFHLDPADRLIVATAIQYDATLFTADRRILNWKGEMNILDARL